MILSPNWYFMFLKTLIAVICIKKQQIKVRSKQAKKGAPLKRLIELTRLK
jgi:hypothetical protein